MDYRILVYFVLLRCSINALPYEKDSHESGDFTLNFEDEDGDHLKNLDEQQAVSLHDDDQTIFEVDEQQQEKTLDFEKKIVTDKPEPAKYEVTEFIVDLPDDRTKGPIVTDFKLSKPLNVASTPTPSSENNEKDKNTDNSENNVDNVKEIDEKEDGTGKKNYISILHVKAEFDNKNDKTNKDRIETSDFDFGNVPHVSGIKEYFKGIKQGIVNGFNSIIHKHKHNEENHTHDANTGPFSFINKIHKKSSDFAHKIHNHIFGEQEEDHF